MMAVLKRKTGTTRVIKKELLDAVQRLKAKKPKDKKLQADIRNGTFKFTQANVLKESGQNGSTLHSKSYEDVRKIIKETAEELAPKNRRGSKQMFTPSMETIRELKTTLSERLSLTDNLSIDHKELTNKMLQQDEELERYKQQNERLKDQLKEALKEIKRLKSDREDGSNVIQF